MDKFILRLIINGLGLYAAVSLVPGIVLHNAETVTYVWLAVIFGVLNALVKPLLKFLTCSIIFVTLGLFTLIINTGMFYLTAYIGSNFGINLTIENFWAAFLGALIVSVISVFFNMVLRDELNGKNRRKRRRKTE